MAAKRLAGLTHGKGVKLMDRMKPTLKDVALQANTSVATASVVLNRSKNKYVSDELRQRVLQAAEELQYRPNLAARRMKGKNGKFLAILVPQFENIFFNRIVIGAEEYANERGYTLSIFSTHDEEEREISFIENLISLQVDGILISPAENRSRSVELIREMGIPYVVIDRMVTGEDFDFVGVDNYQAAYAGTRLLLANGHRKIAFFTWQSRLNTITDRIKGFQDAFRDTGIDAGGTKIFEEKLSREAASELTLRVLTQHEFSAIFAGHHHIGEGIVDALRVLNRRVPDDLSMLIFGNPTWASITSPQFTCIAQPDLEVGRKAAERIINLLENPVHQTERIVLPMEIVCRESIRNLSAQG